MYLFPTPKEGEGQRSMSFNSLPYLPCQACHPWSVHLPSTAAEPYGFRDPCYCAGGRGGLHFQLQVHDFSPSSQILDRFRELNNLALKPANTHKSQPNHVQKPNPHPRRLGRRLGPPSRPPLQTPGRPLTTITTTTTTSAPLQSRASRETPRGAAQIMGVSVRPSTPKPFPHH